MPKIYYQADCDINVLKDKTVAVIGYGSQGHACLLYTSSIHINEKKPVKPKENSFLWNQTVKIAVWKNIRKQDG